ncbi:hypothetical protein NCCP2050_19970 [Planococcus sp. NCCP-2050]|nr:hypothetical protein NCCP2050_19970 [Planococcus sp. NCCP-2050]
MGIGSFVVVRGSLCTFRREYARSKRFVRVQKKMRAFAKGTVQNP